VSSSPAPVNSNGTPGSSASPAPVNSNGTPGSSSSPAPVNSNGTSSPPSPTQTNGSANSSGYWSGDAAILAQAAAGVTPVVVPAATSSKVPLLVGAGVLVAGVAGVFYYKKKQKKTPRRS
jgi:LPXTG-motif cell wall-anchored protein